MFLLNMTSRIALREFWKDPIKQMNTYKYRIATTILFSLEGKKNTFSSGATVHKIEDGRVAGRWPALGFTLQPTLRCSLLNAAAFFMLQPALRCSLLYATAYFTLQPTLRYSLLYAAAYFTLQPTLRCSLLYAAAYFTLQPTLRCSLIYAAAYFTLPPTLRCSLLYHRPSSRDPLPT